MLSHLVASGRAATFKQFEQVHGDSAEGEIEDAGSLMDLAVLAKQSNWNISDEAKRTMGLIE